MVVSFWHQRIDATLPLQQVSVYTGSALALDLIDVIDELNGIPVSAVSVTVTNANGTPVTGAATRVSRGKWRVLFAASNFTTYGFVSMGLKVTATATSDGVSYSAIIGMGDVNVVKSEAGAAPGEDKRYVERGSDVFIKTGVIGEVQHYTKQVMQYDAEIGWGAEWVGDYILVDGEFVEVQ